jgi:hypothetical protein
MKYILSFFLGATVIYYSGSSCSEKKPETPSEQKSIVKERKKKADSYDSVEEWNKRQVAEILERIDYKIQKIKDLLDLGPQTPAMLGIKEDCFIALHEKGMFKESIRDK